MFFITALYLYADLGQTRQPRRLQSVSQAFVDSIPRDELIAVTPLNPDATAADARYDVMIGGLPQSQAATDLAKQLVTTISTLVVAVASFYFGANTVQSATRRRPPPSGPGAAPVPEPEPEPEAAPVNEDAEKRDDDERPLAG
jgi:hypothetical protein